MRCCTYWFYGFIIWDITFFVILQFGEYLWLCGSSMKSERVQPCEERTFFLMWKVFSGGHQSICTMCRIVPYRSSPRGLFQLLTPSAQGYKATWRSTHFHQSGHRTDCFPPISEQRNGEKRRDADVAEVLTVRIEVLLWALVSGGNYL